MTLPETTFYVKDLKLGLINDCDAPYVQISPGHKHGRYSLTWAPGCRPHHVNLTYDWPKVEVIYNIENNTAKKIRK